MATATAGGLANEAGLANLEVNRRAIHQPSDYKVVATGNVNAICEVNCPSNNSPVASVSAIDLTNSR